MVHRVQQEYGKLDILVNKWVLLFALPCLPLLRQLPPMPILVNK